MPYTDYQTMKIISYRLGITREKFRTIVFIGNIKPIKRGREYVYDFRVIKSLYDLVEKECSPEQIQKTASAGNCSQINSIRLGRTEVGSSS
jgi:hypothetical protein